MGKINKFKKGQEPLDLVYFCPQKTIYDHFQFPRTQPVFIKSR